jgi:ADP-dependent NAD(P)H-hydrate dehydratase / NAD(P)H-hydrate epimerase
MKVLTAAEMREVDRLTIEAGIPGIILMENAAHRVVEFLTRTFEPLDEQRIVILCGKGNNGGDGLAIARQIPTATTVLLADSAELKGDASGNYRMLLATGATIHSEIPAEAHNATLVIDALLGTGIKGPASGRMLDGIRAINSGFPLAKVLAVDMPSGMPSDPGIEAGEIARADYTVTFTAPKVAQVIPPGCDGVGELHVAEIGSREDFYAQVKLEVVEPAMFADLLAPRPPSGHKGTFGHVLVIAGSRGKTGAAAMTGLAALRAGAGLVTVASEAAALPQIASHAPELMTEELPADPAPLLEHKTVVAIGPGLGHKPDLVTSLTNTTDLPMVIDADALTVVSGKDRIRVLTPHPGEMARLTGKSTADVQADRIGVARGFATAHSVTLVLKGQRTVIAFPDGRVWINPTGTPALGTGGSGDILTGLIAGLLAQFPGQSDQAVAAAIYLHGLAGEIGARELNEKYLIATDILRFLPAAMEECADVPHRLGR